ncbi:MAG: ATP-binding protein [Candidatus Sumerlaeaceae bacterium]|nr:ATP-binding protein [Candidatus Sumerlaeaceae bacterium]
MAAESTPCIPNPRIELKCCVDSSMLGPLRQFVSAVARTVGFSDQQVDEIEICVDEACANALEHAYAAEPYQREFPSNDRNICIEMAFVGNELTVRVIDHGRGADHEFHQKLKDLEQYLESDKERFRGLGFYLMHKFMDQVAVHSLPGKGTTVELKKIRK